MVFPSVVLPLPDSPTNPTISPGAISRLTASSARNGGAAASHCTAPKSSVRSRTCMVAPDALSMCGSLFMKQASRDVTVADRNQLWLRRAAFRHDFRAARREDAPFGGAASSRFALEL